MSEITPLPVATPIRAETPEQMAEQIAEARAAFCKHYHAVYTQFVATHAAVTTMELANGLGGSRTYIVGTVSFSIPK